MSYVDSNLLPGEQVTFRTHLSLIIFTLPVALAVLAMVFYLIGPGTRLIGHIFLLGALALGPMKYLDYATSEFAVTNKRIIISRDGGYHGLHGFGTRLAGIPFNREGYGSASLLTATARVPVAGSSRISS